MYKQAHFHLMNEVTEAPTAVQAAPAVAPVATAATPAVPASVPTALASAATAPAAIAPVEEFKFAEKVLVTKDGVSDWEATARNAEQARQHLERRLGSGDMPPAAATDYKLTIPEAFAEKVKADELSKDAGFQEFSKSLHAAGLSQKQYDMVVAEFLDRGEKMRHGIEAMDSAACVGALKQLPGWQSDADYGKQMGKAVAAAKAYGGEDFQAIMTDYGNDPRICKLLAAVGAEVSEDTQASPEQTAATVQSLETLMSSKAYLNDRDPMHTTVVAQVTALQERVAGNRPVVGGRSMGFKT